VSREIVVTDDFFPKVGGAHLWLYETYRRWPTPVTVLTRAAADTQAAEAFDRADHGAVRVLRSLPAVRDINLLSRACRAAFGTAAALLGTLAGSERANFHCLRAFPEGFCGLLAKLRRPRARRLIVYAHGEEILVARSSRQLRVIAGLVYRFADLVIANSRNTESLVKALCPRARVVCIHPGVDAGAFARSPEEIAAFRRTWGWPQDTVIVSTVARMEPRKNQAAVIRALHALRQSGLPVAYVCGGDGEERARLMSLAEELGLSEWVRFPGVLSDSDKVLTFAASDLHAMPSIRHGEMIEGFGIVFLEAAAAGIPSVCGESGGQREAVQNRATGLVVDGSDLAAVTEAIRLLASDPSVRSRMGALAKEHARQHDWTKVSAATRAAVEACAHGRSAGTLTGFEPI